MRHFWCQNSNHLQEQKIGKMTQTFIWDIFFISKHCEIEDIITLQSKGCWNLKKNQLLGQKMPKVQKRYDMQKSNFKVCFSTVTNHMQKVTLSERKIWNFVQPYYVIMVTHIVWKFHKMSHLKFLILTFSTNFCAI